LSDDTVRDEIWERMQEGFEAQERERAEVEALRCSKRHPSRPDEILAARAAATRRYALTQHAFPMNGKLESADLGESWSNGIE
jgi:hypothetical protein